jgi:hypothetical protein
VCLLLCCSAGLLLLAGCQQDPIASYRVPKEQPPSASSDSQVRLLAAIFPRPDETWFFKLSGPVKAVDDQEKTFGSFIRSVRFSGGAEKPVTWEVPPGWRQEPAGPRNGEQLRYATFRLGPAGPRNGEQPLELTVVKLGGVAGSVLANVNRWRGQIGLSDITEDKLPTVSRELKVGDTTTRLVDMTGPGAKKGTGKPPFASGRMPAGHPPLGTRKPFHFTRPEGWEELPDPWSRPLPAAAAFRAGKDRGAPEVTVTPLGGAAGGLLANVNRWRGQVGLAPVEEGDLQKDLHTLDVDGKPAPYVDLAGQGSSGRRILAVLAVRGGTTWFFKMMGPADAVGRHKAAFEQFVKSVRFDSEFKNEEQ